MSNIKICQDIIEVPDLHINYHKLDVAQRFHRRRQDGLSYDQHGFDVRFLVVLENGFTKSLYRVEVAEQLDKTSMNLRRLSGALLEFTDELFSVLATYWPKVKRFHHVQAMSFEDRRGGELLLCQAIRGDGYFEDYWRPRQTIRSLTDYQAWVKSNKVENLRHYQLMIPAPVWEELSKHFEALGYRPTYRMNTLQS